MTLNFLLFCWLVSRYCLIFSLPSFFACPSDSLNFTHCCFACIPCAVSLSLILFSPRSSLPEFTYKITISLIDLSLKISERRWSTKRSRQHWHKTKQEGKSNVIELTFVIVVVGSLMSEWEYSLQSSFWSHAINSDSNFHARICTYPCSIFIFHRVTFFLQKRRDDNESDLPHLVDLSFRHRQSIAYLVKWNGFSLHIYSFFSCFQYNNKKQQQQQQ